MLHYPDIDPVAISLGPLAIHWYGLLYVFGIAGAWWLLSRSTMGFRFRAVGHNPHAARTAGISVGRSYTAVMFIGGGLAGLAGATQLMGTARFLSEGFAGSLGFDAITVALLGRSNPWGTLAAGILFGALRAGAVRMQAQTGTPIDIVLVVQSLIVLFIAAPPLVRAIFRIKVRAARPLAPELGGQQA
jgi:simple sugar transport system permease protein